MKAKPKETRTGFRWATLTGFRWDSCLVILTHSDWKMEKWMEIRSGFRWAIYSDFRMPIVSVDEAARIATLTLDPRPSNKEADARYFIENAPDGLDTAGEWYLDRKAGTVSYWPVAGENMESEVVVAPALTQLIAPSWMVFLASGRSKSPVSIDTGLLPEVPDWGCTSEWKPLFVLGFRRLFLGQRGLEDILLRLLQGVNERRKIAGDMEAAARFLTRNGYAGEVIVVDDGSRISPEHALKTFGDRIPLRLLKQRHAGPASARNAGAYQARGSFLAFTDDDCRPARNWLKELGRNLQKNPVSMVGGRVVWGTLG